MYCCTPKVLYMLSVSPQPPPDGYIHMNVEIVEIPQEKDSLTFEANKRQYI